MHPNVVVPPGTNAEVEFGDVEGGALRSNLDRLAQGDPPRSWEASFWDWRQGPNVDENSGIPLRGRYGGIASFGSAQEHFALGWRKNSISPAVGRPETMVGKEDGQKGLVASLHRPTTSSKTRLLNARDKGRCWVGPGVCCAVIRRWLAVGLARRRGQPARGRDAFLFPETAMVFFFG